MIAFYRLDQMQSEIELFPKHLVAVVIVNGNKKNCCQRPYFGNDFTLPVCLRLKANHMKIIQVSRNDVHKAQMCRKL